MTTNALLGGLAATALTLLTAFPSESADARSAYSFDQASYVRARVTVTYGDVTKPIDLTEGCPKNGIFSKDGDFGKTLSELVKSDRTYNIGFTVLTPSGKQIQLTPMEISIKKVLLGPSKCNIKIERIEYVSPLFASAANPLMNFRFEPAIYVREKPSTDLIKATGDALKGILTIAGAPEAVGAAASGLVANTLEGAGVNYSASYAVQIPILPPASGTSEATWRADTGLTGEKKQLKIHAYLENVASLLRPNDAKLTKTTFEDANADRIMGAPFLPNFGDGTLSDIDGLVTFATRNTADYAAFKAAPSAVLANGPCNNIYALLGSYGLTETDRALVVWALARSHPNLGGKKDPTLNIEQQTCIKTREATLKSVGIVLIDNATTSWISAKLGDLRSMLELDDIYAVFFKGADDLATVTAAQQLFVAQPGFEDSEAIIFNTTSQTLSSNTVFRLYDRTKDSPLLSKFGCLTYFPSETPMPVAENSTPSVVWGIGLTPDDREVAVKAAIPPAKVDGGTKTQEPFKISRLEVRQNLDASTREAIVAARKGAACGGDWKPKLLFGS